MSRVVWKEVVYRCDSKNCRTWNGVSHQMAEEVIPGSAKEADIQIKGFGWVIKKDGTCYCPSCAKVIKNA